MTDAPRSRRALRPRTKIVWVETPSNPLWRVTDVAAVAALAHGAGAVCVCDNTSAPVIQRPLALGADLVVYATTKYLGGHGDVLGGAVVARTRDAFFDARAGHPGLGRRRAVAVRLLARAPRHPHAAVAHARALATTR